MKNFSNIIYIATAEKKAVGGIKIIYDHCQVINNLNSKSLSSEILHLKKKKITKWKESWQKFSKIYNKNKFSGWSFQEMKIDSKFRAEWFKNNIKVKKNLKFNKDKDFIIFPEIFAHFAKDLCLKNNIRYGIYALNGYSLNPTNDYKTLEEVYSKAEFIMAISDDIIKCLKIAFPKININKVIKINIAVNKNKFNFKLKKKNMITYMPRKIPDHAETILFFVRNHISKKWKIQKIHGLKERDVFNLLSQSKIFLSITKSEGLGMPAIEAAIAGNKVIGYTGEGGKEFWKKPIFTEIPHGNAIKFASEIIKATKEKLPKFKFKNQRNKIINKFSSKNEKAKLLKIINLINKRKRS